MTYELRCSDMSLSFQHTRAVVAVLKTEKLRTSTVKLSVIGNVVNVTSRAYKCSLSCLHPIMHLLVQSLDDLMDGLQLLGSWNLRSLCHEAGLVLFMRLEGALHPEEGLCGGVHFGGAGAAATATT